MRPSQFLEIEDDLLAYQIDLALAARGQQTEYEYLSKIIENINENVHVNSVMIARSMGAKVKPQTKKNKEIELKDGMPTLESVLAVHGGKGVIMKG